MARTNRRDVLAAGEMREECSIGTVQCSADAGFDYSMTDIRIIELVLFLKE